uniref:Uncharacterized protein n=1 Tax=Paramormyrops kingsleyae TaxID=1676925 RepID=A0A3B3R4G8_9TELE
MHAREGDMVFKTEGLNCTTCSVGTNNSSESSSCPAWPQFSSISHLCLYTGMVVKFCTFGTFCDEARHGKCEFTDNCSSPHQAESHRELVVQPCPTLALRAPLVKLFIEKL